VLLGTAEIGEEPTINPRFTKDPMVNHSNSVQYWMALHLVPQEFAPVVGILHKMGIEVCRFGMENPKAPLYYAFVDRPFDVTTLLTEIREITGVKGFADGVGIASMEFLWVGYEPGVCGLG
jgi:hypothetical protein